MPEGPSYAYPVWRTGTSQDLMAIVTKAYEVHLERTKTALPAKTDSRRNLLGPPFICAGFLVSWLAALAPADRVLEAHDALLRMLAKPRHYPFDEASPVLVRAVELARTIERDCGRSPALMALISHPPVMGELAHLNFELVRHATLALRRLRGAPCRPRLVVAVDPFALDTIPSHEEGLYAGCMGGYHLGLDRLAYCRGALGRWLLKKTSWDRMPWRMLGLLGRGGEAGLALSGGVPATSRALYAVREWVAWTRRSSPLLGKPGEVLARLRGVAEFVNFESSWPHGTALRSAWRLMEAWGMSALSGVFTENGPAEVSCADSGKLSGEAKTVFSGILKALDSPRHKEALEDLAEELSRETPYRARLFRIFAGRLVKKGRPVVFLPVAHRLEGGLGIEVKDAWAWTGMAGGRLKVAVASETPSSWEGTVEDFARRFGQANFA